MKLEERFSLYHMCILEKKVIENKAINEIKGRGKNVL